MSDDKWPYGVGWKPDSELLPCPFCGSVAVIKTIGNDHTDKRGFDVRCSDIQCRFGRSDRVMTQSQEWLRPKVLAAWNTRPTPGNNKIGE